MKPPNDLIENLANTICKKQKDIPISACQELKKHLCRKKTKCVILEKNEEQLAYICSAVNEHIFLNACPGSGKTEALGLKTAYEIAKWGNNLGGIAVLTFTNSAADVIEDRVYQLSGTDVIGFPHFIGTIDSWLHKYIAHPFAHRITGYDGKSNDRSIRVVDDSSTSDFLNSFVVPYSKGLKANQYYEDIFAHRYFCRDKTLPDEKNEHLEKTKRLFWKAGFATYQDVENFCYKLLSDEKINLAHKIAKRFPFIVVDECQDLSNIQLQILGILKEKGSFLHFVGDLSQSIYEFKKVNPDLVKEFAAKNQLTHQKLSINYRSCQKICDICSRIVTGSIKQVSSSNTNICTRPAVFLEYSDNNIHELGIWFENYLRVQGIRKEDSIILARGYTTISKLRHYKEEEKRKEFLFATAIYLWRNDKSRIIDSLKYLGKFMAESYFKNEYHSSGEYYRPESISSGIKWRLFLANMAASCVSDPNLSNLEQKWNVWCKSIRTSIINHLLACQHIIEIDFQKILNAKKITTPPNRDGNVLDIFDASNKNKASIRIETIHKAKGQEFDAVMLVSSSSLRGTPDGHWTRWLATGKNEAARFAYVASSRPKHLLVWAIPVDHNRTDYQKLLDLGFHNEEFKTECT